MTSTNTSARGPLSGLRVIDAGNLVAGPLTCTLLGDLGADVIKVEQPRSGDPCRFYGPQVDGHGLFWKILSGTLGDERSCYDWSGRRTSSSRTSERGPSAGGGSRGSSCGC